MGEHKSRSASHAGAHNSRLSFETLLQSLVIDLGSSKGLPISANDLVTLTRRLRAEGPQFAYRTLSQVSEALLTLLEFEHFPAEHAFARLPDSKIPKFFGGLWRELMDPTGQIRPDIGESYAAVQSVAGLLQVGAALTKYSDGAPWDLIPELCDEFVAMDQALSDLTFPRALISSAGNVITQIFDQFKLADIVPRHGPGAVATGERDERKWEFNRLLLSAEPFYPYHEYFMAGAGLMDPFQLVDQAEHLATVYASRTVATGQAKVVFVEKTATKLRTISMEPVELQFLQQGQMTAMVTHLQGHPITRGHVNFDDQTINRNLALVNSRSQDMATIDLSAASDRLSLDLVRALFTNVSGNVLDYLLATRSTHTRLPNGVVLKMNKFAPMGSAVCFPVQSVCFFALCVAAIQLSHNVPLHVAAKAVYVFGDDIIVKTEYVGSVMTALEQVGLRVNRAKSFVRGLFKESCGMFAFNGVDVTPIRFKTAFPRTRADGRAIAAWLSYAHECERRGYSTTAEYIYSIIEPLTGKLPYGLDGCGYFCRRATSYQQVKEETIKSSHQIRWNKSLSRLEVKALGLYSPFREVDFSSPWARLLRDLLTDSSMSDPSKITVARAVKPKAGWHQLL